jgi:hypothetical protein
MSMGELMRRLMKEWSRRRRRRRRRRRLCHLM